MYSHRVNSPKNLAKYSGNSSSKTVRMQAPHVFAQKLIPQELIGRFLMGLVQMGSE